MNLIYIVIIPVFVLILVLLYIGPSGQKDTEYLKKKRFKRKLDYGPRKPRDKGAENGKEKNDGEDSGFFGSLKGAT